MASPELILHRVVGGSAADDENGDGPDENPHRPQDSHKSAQAHPQIDLHECWQAHAVAEPQSDIPLDLQNQASCEDAHGC